MPSVLRLIDANANRAREALRVMEDAARFVLDDRELTESLKNLRHDLVAAMRRLDGLEFNRDTLEDVGAEISTGSETHRGSAAEVVLAAGKRLSEGLRAIEEFAKLVDVELAAAVEAMRYRGYELERRVDRAMTGGRARQWRVCVLLTESLCGGRRWQDVVASTLAGGADCIQLREKSLPDAEVLARARELVQLARPYGASVIINDRPDIALSSGADGVHVGQHDLPCAEVRRLVGRQLLVGVSTSRLDQAIQARLDGADYCGAGPMFPSSTKPKDHIAGPAYLRQYLDWNGLPHLAIGGITPANIAELVAAGARGVAVSATVCQAQQPDEVVRDLLAALSNRHTPVARPA